MRILIALALLALPAVPYARESAPAPTTPCTQAATTACTEWIPLAGGPARSMIYTSFPLTTQNYSVKRALIMIHGTNRNADHYFQTATTAAFLAGALSDTIVISPAIHSSSGNGCKDQLQPNEVNWSCGGDSWRSGGNALSDPKLTSFDFIDELLRKLADKKTFPNLTQIVVAGHSAGGQFVARYAMANHVADTLGTAVSYVVANPSSYAWPDSTRPQPTGDGAPEAAVKGWDSEQPHTNFTFGAFDSMKAPKYDLWPYGLAERTTGYTVKMSNDQLIKQLTTRNVTYLLSQVDTLPLGGFDSSANAMAQGATRRARGEAFVKYLHDKFGANPTTLVIPECGHNDRCVYTTDAALPYIFPKP
jgi:pimeloyl-ACP methyl ester carboxylesterase